MSAQANKFNKCNENYNNKNIDERFPSLQIKHLDCSARCPNLHLNINNDNQIKKENKEIEKRKEKIYQSKFLKREIIYNRISKENLKNPNIQKNLLKEKMKVYGMLVNKRAFPTLQVENSSYLSSNSVSNRSNSLNNFQRMKSFCMKEDAISSDQKLEFDRRIQQKITTNNELLKKLRKRPIVERNSSKKIEIHSHPLSMSLQMKSSD